MPPLAGVRWVGCGRLSPQSRGSPPGGPGPGASVNGARLRRPRGWASGKKAPWRGQSRGGPAPPRLPPACAGLRGGGFLSQPPCWGGRGLGGSAWSPTVALARADRDPRVRTPLVPGPEPSGARSRAVTLGRGSVGPKLQSPFCPTLNVGQGDAVRGAPFRFTACLSALPLRVRPGLLSLAPGGGHLLTTWPLTGLPLSHPTLLPWEPSAVSRKVLLHVWTCTCCPLIPAVGIVFNRPWPTPARRTGLRWVPPPGGLPGAQAMVAPVLTPPQSLGLCLS